MDSLVLDRENAGRISAPFWDHGVVVGDQGCACVRVDTAKHCTRGSFGSMIPECSLQAGQAPTACREIYLTNDIADKHTYTSRSGWKWQALSNIYLHVYWLVHEEKVQQALHQSARLLHLCFDRAVLKRGEMADVKVILRLTSIMDSSSVLSGSSSILSLA